MIIIPAIDIIRGKVVRLDQGDFNKEKVYSDDPLKMAISWQDKGASFLHIVDLDGAKTGEVINRDAISRIIKGVRVPCEIGGGLRKEEDVEYFLKEGAKRVVLGTRAIEDEDFLKSLVSKFGEKIIVGIDFRGDKVAKKGWQEETLLSPDEAIRKVEAVGVKTIVVTDIATDGVLKGPNIERLKKILASTGASVIASGGVSGLEDLKKLKSLAAKNLEGVIIGRALYEGTLTLEEAIKALC